MKFSGIIGFGIPSEDAGAREGNWEEMIVERPYYGDVLQSTQRWSDNPNTVHDDLKISDRISVVADAFAENHISTLRYISYMGALWKITSIETKRPRLILTIGGLYHGPTPEPS